MSARHTTTFNPYACTNLQCQIMLHDCVHVPRLAITSCLHCSVPSGAERQCWKEAKGLALQQRQGQVTTRERGRRMGVDEALRDQRRGLPA